MGRREGEGRSQERVTIGDDGDERMEQKKKCPEVQTPIIFLWVRVY